MSNSLSPALPDVKSFVKTSVPLLNSKLTNTTSFKKPAGYTPYDVTEIRYIKFPSEKGIKRELDFAAASQLIPFMLEAADVSRSEAICIFFSFIELVFPESMKGISNVCTNASVKFVPALKSSEDFKYLSSGTDDNNVYSEGLSLDPELENTRIMFNSTLVDNINSYHLATIVGIMLWSLVKVPMPENSVAFTERRFNALARKMNEPILSEPYRPSIKFYQHINGYFNMQHVARKAIVDHFKTFFDPTTSESLRDTSVMVFKFWINAGMTHVRLVTDMINNIGHILISIPQLRSEVAKWMQETQALDLANDAKTAELALYKVYNGDQSVIFASRNYQELLKIAKHLQQEQDVQYNLYAQGLADSAFWPIVKEKIARETGVELSKILPAPDVAPAE